MKRTPIIGLEIHIQLKTKSKMFSSSSNDALGKEANTTISPIDLGHPGVLPVPNKQAIEYGVLLGLALNCQINEESKFDRKNYFYPDLPKGYQISQFDQPICEHGTLFIEAHNQKRSIGITRLHLEEDAAKNTHTTDGMTLVDFNRAGTPLVELVSEPDLRSAEEAKAFMQKLRQIVRYLGISDADMENGNLRCDANISMYEGDAENLDMEKLNPKTEVKNLNSFKSVGKAIEYEIQRQNELLDKGEIPEHATRGFDDDKAITFIQRTKEESHDYRYFPEPDIPPLNLKEYKEKLISSLPELPDAKKERFMKQFGLSSSDSDVLIAEKTIAQWYEQVLSELQGWIISSQELEESKEEFWEKNKKKLAKLASNWITSKLFGLLNEKEISFDDLHITPENMAELITLVHTNKLNSANAMKVLQLMLENEYDVSPTNIMQEHDLSQVSDESELIQVAQQILHENPDQVEAYKNGKTTILQFFVGQMMKKTKGKANPQMASNMFEDLLKQM